MVSKHFANSTDLSFAIPLWNRLENHQDLVLLREVHSRRGMGLLPKVCFDLERD